MKIIRFKSTTTIQLIHTFLRSNYGIFYRPKMKIKVRPRTLFTILAILLRLSNFRLNTIKTIRGRDVVEYYIVEKKKKNC